MKISILTLFPEMFVGPFGHSIIKRAKEKKLVEIYFSNIRDFGIGKHKIVDDTPYGGGAGMLMRVDVVANAIHHAKCQTPCKELTILLDANGKQFNQELAEQLTSYEHLIFVCGHYEGIDARIQDIVDLTISIGDFVLTGGEIPAMVIVDTVTRLLPGVLGKDVSSENESFQKVLHENKEKRLLEYPQYTRPETFNDISVPNVLLSGNHKNITEWRQKMAIEITEKNRKDLLEK